MNVRDFHFVYPLFFHLHLYQNLLRTLTEAQVKASLADTDLKLLLSTVKEGRVCHTHKPAPDRPAPHLGLQRQTQDAKLSDAFYESLEGLLNDLRTVTLVTQLSREWHSTKPTTL